MDEGTDSAPRRPVDGLELGAGCLELTRRVLLFPSMVAFSQSSGVGRPPRTRTAGRAAKLRGKDATASLGIVSERLVCPGPVSSVPSRVAPRGGCGGSILTSNRRLQPCLEVRRFPGKLHSTSDLALPRQRLLVPAKRIRMKTSSLTGWRCHRSVQGSLEARVVTGTWSVYVNIPTK